MHKNNLELATEIIVAMLENNYISNPTTLKSETSNNVAKALETVFNKLEELDESSRAKISDAEFVSQVI